MNFSFYVIFMDYIDLNSNHYLEKEFSGKKILLPGLSKLGRINDKNIIFSPFNSRIYFIEDNEIKSLNEEKSREYQLIIGEDCIPKRSENFDNENISINIFPTDSCNLKCKYCYANYGKRSNNFQKELFDKFIEQYCKNKKRIDVIFHGGGEPLCNIELIKYVINRLKEMKVKYSIGLQTNGYFSEDVLNWILKEKIMLSVSYDGLSDIQNYQRPALDDKKTSEIVERNIKKLIENGITPPIVSTITDYCVKKQYQIIYNVFKMGIKDIQLCILEPTKHSHGKGITRPDLDEYGREFLKAKELADEFSINLWSPEFQIHGPKISFCGCCSSQFCITQDGLITSCFKSFSKDSEKNFIFGEFDGKKEKFIIDEKKKQEFFNLKPEKNNKCLNCFLRWTCAGGCPANQYNENMEPKDEICDFKRKIIKDYIFFRVEKDYLNKFPHILEEDGKKYLKMYFNKFLLSEKFQDNPIIKINSDTNFNDLLKNILYHENKRRPEPTIFLFKIENFSEKIKPIFIEFIEKLNENRIFYKFMNSVPYCLFPDLDFVKYDIPKENKDRLDLFSIKDGFVYRNNKKYGKFDEYSNKNDIINDLNIQNKKINCRYKTRGKCIFDGDLVD